MFAVWMREVGGRGVFVAGERRGPNFDILLISTTWSSSGMFLSGAIPNLATGASYSHGTARHRPSLLLDSRSPDEQED